MNIRELLTGDLQRLQYVRRWGVCRVVYPESVAAHTCSVALYAMMIALWCNATGAASVDPHVCVSKAILHDLEEARTTDLPRPIKHGSDVLAKELDKVGSAEVRNMLNAVFGKELGEMPMGPTGWMHLMWERSKKGDDKESAVVSFADFLATFAYLLQEKGANPDFVKGYANTTPEQFRKFNEDRYEFLRELVDQAGTLVEETFWVPVKTRGHLELAIWNATHKLRKVLLGEQPG